MKICQKMKLSVIKIVLFIYMLFFFSNTVHLQSLPDFAKSFVQKRNTQLFHNGQPYYFIGTNFWYGMNLGIANNPDHRARLIRELDRLEEMGVNNLRIMAASEGPDTEPWRMVPTLQPKLGVYNEELLEGLDFLLFEMKKRKMVAVVCLNNMWPWSGGFAQYINWITNKPIPYPPPAPKGKWLKYMNYAAKFFKNQAAQEAYQKHIEIIINRINSVSNIPYKEDNTIMAWQLANEPRAILSNKAYRRWIRKTAKYIKSLDPYHLVSIGSEGNAFLPLSSKFKKEHRIKDIDYATMHIWVQNWGWYNPQMPHQDFQKALSKAKKYIDRHIAIAQKFKKPLVLEEFGIARDLEHHAPNTSTEYRDVYFQHIFDIVYKGIESNLPIIGCNFWAWAGEGRPSMPKSIWKANDDFTGDPPFEYQGWYSVFDSDESTIKVISKYAKMMNEIGSGKN